MLKFTLIGALLCATTFVGECAMETPNLTRNLTITMPKSTSVPIGDQMYTVSMTNSNVHVNSSDSNHKPCDLTIDPAKDSIKGKMKVIVSDDMIYILGEHGDETIDGKDTTKYTLLMIDPHNCTLKSADVPNGERTNSLPDLVVQKMGVDVFFPKMQTCAPCQFWNNGTEKDMPPQIPAVKPSKDGWTMPYHIQKMDSNYLYAQGMEGDKTMMKVLDGKKMDVVKEKQVDHSVDTMTNASAEIMGICSKKYDNMMMDIVAFKEINCERINSELESSVPIKISISPYSRPISSISFGIDKDTGNSYIGFARDQNIVVFVHNAEGKEMKSYDMGKIDERFEKYHHQPLYYYPYAHWDVRGFIIGDEYCLVTEQVSDMHEVDLHDIRCINLEK